MDKEKKPNITVHSFKSGGYGLTVDGHEYMYWSVEDLILGMCVRVADNFHNPMDIDVLRELVADHLKTSERINAQNAKIEKAHANQLKAKDKTIAELTSTISELKKQIKEMKNG